MIELAVAFAGGTLSLLSPCSALLLPSFFAYAFADPKRLLFRTLIFYAGMLTLFVPLGLGVGALGAIVREHLTAVTATAGGLLILIGVYQLVVGGFTVPGSGAFGGRVSGESATATYVLGMVYGVGGFCSGPILAGILTLATASGRPVTGAVLLAVFGLGMTAPLFVLALVWERRGVARRKWRGKTLRIGPVERHWSTIVSSLIFVALGAAFIAFRGANALSGLYERAGASDLVFRVEEWIRGHSTMVAIAFAAVVGLLLLTVARRVLRKGAPPGTAAEPVPAGDAAAGEPITLPRR